MKKDALGKEHMLQYRNDTYFGIFLVTTKSNDLTNFQREPGNQRTCNAVCGRNEIKLVNLKSTWYEKNW